MKDSFVLHIDSLSILEKMSDAQVGVFFKAIYKYHITGNLPPLDFGLEMAITPFINQFKRDEKKYLKKVEKNKLNGSLGGKARAERIASAKKTSKRYKIVANQADNDNDNDNDSVNDNDNKERMALILKIWNNFANEFSLAPIIKLGEKRKKAIRARARDVDFNLQRILESVAKSKFLLGENDRNWKVDFDFIFCSTNNYLKILEGKYLKSAIKNTKGEKNNDKHRQNLISKGICSDIRNNEIIIS